jgi:hypothetical protein
MKMLLRAWKPILGWGLVFTGVYMAAAAIEMTGVSGTCMFILMPYFASLAVTIPLLVVKRFGTGVGVFIPYVVLGFFPLYFFDWLQNHALVGQWAAFVFVLSGFLIGACLDLAYLLAGRLGERARAIVVGTTQQAVTFVVMLVGLTYLYLPNSSMASHLRFFDRQWLFTLPWMLVNGAFGGYTAHALVKRA